MLRITIELIPHGNIKKARIIGTGFIANDGTGNEGFGNYKAVFRRIKSEQHCTVKKFARKRHSAWDLLMLALNNRQ